MRVSENELAESQVAAAESRAYEQNIAAQSGRFKQQRSLERAEAERPAPMCPEWLKQIVVHFAAMALSIVNAWLYQRVEIAQRKSNFAYV